MSLKPSSLPPVPLTLSLLIPPLTAPPTPFGRPCVYLSKELVCDCGNANEVVWPAVVGVGVGFVIVAFWGMCITSTVRR